MCDEGFIMRGSKIRQCLSTGNWSGNESFCKGTKKYPQIQRECDLFEERGLWSFFDIVLAIVAIIFTFLAINCGVLYSPMYGSISGNLTVYPNIVTFSCNPGFILRGSSLRKCQSNGTWDGYKTVCKGTICKKCSEHSPSRFDLAYM